MLEYTVPHNASLITTGTTTSQSINQPQLKPHILLVVCDDYAIKREEEESPADKESGFRHPVSFLLSVSADLQRQAAAGPVECFYTLSN